MSITSLHMHTLVYVGVCLDLLAFVFTALLFKAGTMSNFVFT